MKPLQKLERDRRLGAVVAQHYLNDRAYHLYHKQVLEPDVQLRNARRSKTRPKGYYVTFDFYIPESWIEGWFVDFDTEGKQTKKTNK